MAKLPVNVYAIKKVAVDPVIRQLTALTTDLLFVSIFHVFCHNRHQL